MDYRIPSLLLALALVLAACQVADSETTLLTGEALPYPETRLVEHIDEYHGTSVSDPYRWFEDEGDAEIAPWVAAQNELSRPLLEGLPKRNEIKDRLTELWNYERYGLPNKEAGRYYYSRNDGLQNQSVIYVTESLDSSEAEVLLDPNGFSEDGTVSLSNYVIDRGGSMMAYSKSDGGSDWRTWHVRSLETGEDLSDLVQFTKFTGASWSSDDSGFYYSRYPLDDDGEGDDSAPVSVYFHTVGTPQSDDQLIYQIPDHPSRQPYAAVTKDGKYLVITVTDRFRNGLYVKDLESDGNVIKLIDTWDARYNYVGNVGSRFLIRTDKEAPNGKLIEIDVDAPARGMSDVIPERETAVRSFGLVGGHLIAQYLEDVKPLVQIHDLSGTLLRDVAFGSIGSVVGFGGEPDDPETFFRFSSFTDPGTTYAYNVATGETREFRSVSMEHIETPPPLDQLETHQVFFSSKDGTRIPMFIVHKKGLEKDGSHPTLLYGYGGFDISLTPSYSPARLVWLEMGGVLAIPNLRGGGEYGAKWHAAGTKLNKQNVFDDFIGAAEYLIAEGYTNPDRLAVQGGSNGGLLVGAVTNQRPELFGAALPAVGVIDMLRYHTASANARNWSYDYGLSENPEEFEALRAYSPVHNINDGTCYPPTLVTTADHDDRVVPWHSFKYAARMQAGQGCSNPILLRVETRAGHGAGTPTWMRIEGIADQWAFLASALGLIESPGPEREPSNPPH